MSEYQRGYNAGLIEIMRMVAVAANRTHYHDTQQELKSSIPGHDEPPASTFEAGRLDAIKDYLSVSVK